LLPVAPTRQPAHWNTAWMAHERRACPRRPSSLSAFPKRRGRDASPPPPPPPRRGAAPPRTLPPPHRLTPGPRGNGIRFHLPSFSLTLRLFSCYSLPHRLPTSPTLLVDRWNFFLYCLVNKCWLGSAPGTLRKLLPREHISL
jgi:hypothetical protein